MEWRRRMENWKVSVGSHAPKPNMIELENELSWRLALMLFSISRLRMVSFDWIEG